MQDDPNFPLWAQKVVLFVIVAAIAVGGSAIGLVIFGVASWINSGSH